MTTYTAEEWRRMNETGQIKVGKKGRIQETPLTPKYKDMLEKNKEPMLSYKDTAEFIISHKLITLNEYILIERGNRYKAAKIKKSLTAVCALFAKDIKGVIDPYKKYDIEFYWTTPDNMCDGDGIFFGVKFILDGIVQAGVLKDDTRRYVRNQHHYIETKKGITQVKIKLIKI